MTFVIINSLFIIKLCGAQAKKDLQSGYKDLQSGLFIKEIIQGEIKTFKGLGFV
jgi:hypothetical protein